MMNNFIGIVIIKKKGKRNLDWQDKNNQVIMLSYNNRTSLGLPMLI